MTHADGINQVKVLQKAFLCWVEEHDELRGLDATTFNELRRRLFRSTFDAFRLGVVGLDKVTSDHQLWRQFFGWIDSHAILHLLPPHLLNEIRGKCFRVTLAAFRLGARVELDRGKDEVQHP